MANDNTITLEGVEYNIDDFSLGDLEWLEDFLGKPMTDLANLNSVKASIGMIYIIRRQQDPAFTLEDARNTKMTAIFSADEPAEKPEAKRPPKKAARA